MMHKKPKRFNDFKFAYQNSNYLPGKPGPAPAGATDDATPRAHQS